jgi:hypothetical protein
VDNVPLPVSGTVNLASGTTVGLAPGSSVSANIAGTPSVNVSSVPARQSFLGTVFSYASYPFGTFTAPAGSHLALKRIHGLFTLLGSAPSPVVLQLNLDTADQPTLTATGSNAYVAQAAYTQFELIPTQIDTVHYMFEVRLDDIRVTSFQLGSQDTTTFFEGWIEGDVVP